MVQVEGRGIDPDTKFTGEAQPAGHRGVRVWRRGRRAEPPGRALCCGQGRGLSARRSPRPPRTQHADPPVLGPFSCPSCLLDLETHNGGTLAGSLFLSAVQRGVPRGEEGLGPHLPTQAARTGLELWPENPTRDRSAFGGGGRGWGRRVLRSAQGHLVTPLENCDHVFITLSSMFRIAS